MQNPSASFIIHIIVLFTTAWPAIASAEIKQPLPLSNTSLSCCTVLRDPIVFEARNSPPYNLNGLAIEYMYELERHLGFRCSSIEQFNGTGTGSTDLIRRMERCSNGSLPRKSPECHCHLGIGGWIATSNRINSVRFLPPFLHTGLSVLTHVENTREGRSTDLLLGAFTPQIWVNIFVLFMLFTVFKCVLPDSNGASTAYESKVNENLFLRLRYCFLSAARWSRIRRSVLSTSFELLGTTSPNEATKQSDVRHSEERSESSFLRNVSTLLVVFCGTLILLAYEASITATLISERDLFSPQDTLKNLRTCLISRRDICVPENGAVESMMNSLFSQSKCQNGILPRRVRSLDESIEAVANKTCKYLITTSISSAHAITGKNVDKIVEVGGPMRRHGVSMIMPMHVEDSIFKHLQHATLYLKETGRFDSLESHFDSRNLFSRGSTLTLASLRWFFIFAYISFGVLFLLLLKPYMQKKATKVENEQQVISQGSDERCEMRNDLRIPTSPAPTCRAPPAASEYDHNNGTDQHMQGSPILSDLRPTSTPPDTLSADVSHEGSDGASANTLIGLVRSVLSEIDIVMSPADKRLLCEFSSASNRMLHPFEQRMNFGVSIGEGPLSPSDARSAQIVQFKPTHLNITVTVETALLTAEGVSLLLWVLPPSPEFIMPVKTVMKATKFKNCLIETVLNEKRDGDNFYLAIPEAWLKWLSLPDSFLEKHKRYDLEGDLGVCVGMDSVVEEEHDDDVISVPSLDEKKGRFWSIRKKLHRKKDNIQSPRYLLPEGTESRERNGEHFLLHQKDGQSYELIYQPSVISVYGMTEVSGGFNIMGGGVSGGYARNLLPESVACHENIAKGMTKVIDSFSVFLRRSLRSKSERPLIPRIRWLGRICKADGIFPAGFNQGFMKAVLKDIACFSTRTVFRDADCRIPSDVLHENSARVAEPPQDGKCNQLFLKECDDSSDYIWTATGTYYVHVNSVAISNFSTMTATKKCNCCLPEYDLI